MELKVLLAIELGDDTSDEQREAFVRALGQKRWIRVKPLVHTWQASFRDDVSEERAVEMSRRDVAEAASEAGVSHYSAALHTGPSLPVVF
ncbi:MAG: hypothetical protein U5L04_15370 [Trueperaceae bacterium]|nr:hypothetical protein [Trueperaceae bacterium]MDZ7705852.1 hypothetical protein [Trueperaceae bacterium]